MNRKELDLTSLPKTIQTMIEDSSNAASIIDELLESKGETNTLAILIMLDDMNIRGNQITFLYKMSNQNIENFYEKVLTLMQDDIDALNEMSYSTCKYKALFTGSKEDRKINPNKYMFTDYERNELRNKKSKERVKDILAESTKTTSVGDLYPSIESKEALSIINKNGFKCGYKKTYENEEGKNIIYRVFSNELGDIMYTYSLETPDIFLYGQSKLNVVRQNTKDIYEDLGCNAYLNIDGVVGYNIELKENPFQTYKKILERKEPIVKNIKHTYFDSNLFPIIESLEGIKYKEEGKDYKAIIIGEIYNLLTFKETYMDLDENLKRIYKTLLESSEEKAYDEILYQLNTDKGIDTALELQNVLGLYLDKDKLVEAKTRFCKANKHHFKIPKTRFLNPFVIEDPISKEIDKRIIKILSNSYKIKE